MSPTGPFYASAAAQSSGGVSWTNLTNAEGAPNGTTAFCGAVGPGGGGGFPNELILTGYGFSLPHTAIIDGIEVQATVETTGGADALDSGRVALNFSGGSTNTANTPNSGQFWPNTGLTLLTYGGPTTLWGKNWLYSDINNSSFGVQLAAFPGTGTASIDVDAAAIIVYWHTAPTAIPRQQYYMYKVYDSLTNAFLGVLPNVSTPYQVARDINSTAAQMTVKCAITADVSSLPSTPLLDQTGANIQDENGNNISDDGVAPMIGTGTSSALIRDGNKVQVWEYSFWRPNGKCRFRGRIDNVQANYGGDTGNTDTQMILYSDGTDVEDFMVSAGTSSYTTDQSQTSQNTSAIIETDGGGVSFTGYGQSWVVGSGITNLGAINLLLAGTANVTLNVWDSPAMETLLTTCYQPVSVGAISVVTFLFPLHIPVATGQSLFLTATVDAGQSIFILYQNTNVYAGGTAYNATYGGGSGGGSYGAITGDLYFQTFETTGSTVANFTNVDPTSGMLETIMNDYSAQGGSLGIGNIQSTGLNITYGFNTNTVNDALTGTVSVSPDDFYFYTDLGADLLYFQEANSVADFKLIKGVHINQLAVTSTVEYIINACYVVGGDDPLNPGQNIYTFDVDLDSINLYGVRLNIHNDTNITDVGTAHVVGQSIISGNKDEAFQTVLSIVGSTMDLTTINPGQIVGLTGFGNYIDATLAQIVHIDESPHQSVCTLGLLPKRQTTTTEQLAKQLVALVTVNNPPVAD